MNISNAMQQLQSFYEQLPELSLIEFYFANLMLKTDFTHDEICVLLEFNPTDEQYELIEDYVCIVDEINYIEDILSEINNSYGEVVIFQDFS